MIYLSILGVGVNGQFLGDWLEIEGPPFCFDFKSMRINNQAKKLNFNHFCLIAPFKVTSHVCLKI